jgi:hypothetical protein
MNIHLAMSVGFGSLEKDEASLVFWANNPIGLVCLKKGLAPRRGWRMWNCAFGCVALAVGGAGCASANRSQPALAAPAAQYEPTPPPAAAVASGRPALAAAASDLPIYHPPKIGVIYLRAHEDAAGRLLGPQVMYQIVEPGGWNLEALERTSPPPNFAAQPVRTSSATALTTAAAPALAATSTAAAASAIAPGAANPVTIEASPAPGGSLSLQPARLPEAPVDTAAPADAGPRTDAGRRDDAGLRGGDAAVTPSGLLDPSWAAKVIFTGLMEKSDQSEAEARAARAGENVRAVFDPEAGWLLVPPAEPPPTPQSPSPPPPP